MLAEAKDRQVIIRKEGKDTMQYRHIEGMIEALEWILNNK